MKLAAGSWKGKNREALKAKKVRESMPAVTKPMASPAADSAEMFLDLTSPVFVAKGNYLRWRGFRKEAVAGA